NLCVVNGSGASVWCSGTAGNPGAIAIVADDGTVRIYGPEGETLWDTYKGVKACNASTFVISNSTSGSATCSYVGQPCTTSTGYYGSCWRNIWSGLYCGTN